MRRVLLAVCGLSPQVITETLYALHQQGRMVDAIRILTTSTGKAKCNEHLMVPKEGQYHRFLADYGMNPADVNFEPDHVIAVKNSAGREMEDIGSEADNGRFLLACMEQAYTLTEDPDSAVCFSIAGGRKTMGACLTIAAQFYAREQDMLYHVLVSPEFESCREFFYPPPQSRELVLTDAKGERIKKETRFARVNLLPLPFVRIRDRLAEDMLRGPEEPQALLDSLVREESRELLVDVKRRKIVWKGKETKMAPARIALYAFFVEAKKEWPCGHSECNNCQECFMEFGDITGRQPQISQLFGMANYRTYETMSDTGILSLNDTNFQSYVSKINTALWNAYPYEAEDLIIGSCGKKPGTRYGVALDREQLRIVF